MYPCCSISVSCDSEIVFLHGLIHLRIIEKCLVSWETVYLSEFLIIQRTIEIICILPLVGCININ